MSNPLHLPSEIRSDDWPGLVRPVRHPVRSGNWTTGWLARWSQRLSCAFASRRRRRVTVLAVGMWLTWCGWSIRQDVSWDFAYWYAQIVRGFPLQSSLQVTGLRTELGELGIVALALGVPLVLLAVHDWLKQSDNAEQPDVT
ncbi:MAG: hypothetical protein B7Z55_15170 [Planctomycetales bacterium 12-60-4]|nr:MAG: hypothetical protein B7Z55_15170 [Planctomycetales bacterium 12-60-4]